MRLFMMRKMSSVFLGILLSMAGCDAKEEAQEEADGADECPPAESDTSAALSLEEASAAASDADGTCPKKKVNSGSQPGTSGGKQTGGVVPTGDGDSVPGDDSVGDNGGDSSVDIVGDSGGDSGESDPVSCPTLEMPDGSGGCVPMTFADATNSAICHDLSGFWYNDACHETGISCDYGNKPSLAQESCVPFDIPDWTDLAGCRDNGGYWYDPADVTKADAAGFAALQPTCHVDRMTGCPVSGNLIFARKQDNSMVSDGVADTSLYLSYQNAAELYTTLRCFDSLTTLTASNGLLQHADVYLLPSLGFLTLASNDLPEIYLNRNPGLVSLNISSNPFIGPVDLSANSGLVYLQIADAGAFDVTMVDYAAMTGLNSLNIGHNDLSSMNMLVLPVSLESLDVSQANLSSLDLDHLINLRNLINNNNYFMNSLDLTALSSLEQYQGYSNWNMTSLNVAGLVNLEFLSAFNCQIGAIDVSGSPNLNYLEVDGNAISSINLANNPLLQVLWLSGNPLASLDLSTNTQLEYLHLSYMTITGALNLSSHTLLRSADFHGSSWSSVNLSGADQLDSVELYAMDNFDLDFTKFHSTFLGLTESDYGTGIYIESAKWDAPLAGVAPAWTNEDYYIAGVKHYFPSN